MAGSSRDYDVLIIGAGPIGLACGIACVEAGLSYLIIDKGPLVNSLYNYPLNMTFFSTSDRLEIGNVPFISHSPKPTRSESLEYYRRVAMHWKLHLDVAMETWRKGADVTMVIRDEQIRDSVKYWIKPDVENRIAEGSIKAYFSAKLTAIRENEVDIQTTSDLITIKNDFVLAMTGYLPDFTFLQQIGIQIFDDAFKTPFHDPSTMETNVAGMYLAGVICGGLKTNKWFIENSRIHAEMIVNHIRSQCSV